MAQETDSIFADGSPSQERAFEDLREALERVGFAIRKKSKDEATLRVYPVKIHTPPLLNPRFRKNPRDIDAGLRGPSLVIDVHIPHESSEWNRRLQAFDRTPDCIFVQNAQTHAGQFHAGWFVLPIAFLADREGQGWISRLSIGRSPAFVRSSSRPEAASPRAVQLRAAEREIR